MCAGGVELLEQLMADQALMSNPNAKQGLEHMGLLFKLLRAYKALDRVLYLSIDYQRYADYL
jgi:histidyl-tRNA synthetase